MAVGDKRPVVMEADRAAANGVATLGEDKLLLPDQRPKADGLLMPDGRTIKAAFDEMVSAVSQLPGQNLLDNSVFIAGCLVDQRQGRVVKTNTTYYSDNKLTTAAGTTSAYVTAYRYATGTASGVNYASFKLTDTDDAPTYYAAPENVVRGYTGAGYGPDRWLMWGNSNVCLITDSGIVTLDATGQTPWFSEKFPVNFLLPGVYTISALFVSKIKSDSPRIIFYCDGIGDLASISDTDDSLIVGTFTIPESAKDKQMWVSFDCSNCDGLKAAKLELGDTQTLAHQDSSGKWQLNELPPDPAVELLKCQRYFRKIFRSYLRLAHVGNGIGRVSIPVDGMRTNPSVSIVGTPAVYKYNDWSTLAGASFSASSIFSNGTAAITVAVSGTTALTNTDWVVNDLTLYLSAEL